MLSYIASKPTSELIESICKDLKITILSQVGEIDFLRYIKETKVNFKLIKYIIIDLESLKDTEENKIKSICYFNEIYPNIRIIILSSGYDEQNKILTTLYEKDIYNIINSNEPKKIKEELIKSLSLEGIQKKEAKRFKKIEQVKTKKGKKQKEKMRQLKNKKEVNKFNNKENEQTLINTSVYFFTLLIQAITKLLELIGIIIIFGLTSLGLTIIFNESLRNILFQILGLK